MVDKKKNNNDFLSGLFKQEVPPPLIAEDKEKPKKQQRSRSIVRRYQNTYRRAFSETQLLDIVDLPFKDGNSYHFITGGDVDALSYLKLILREQDLEYCLFSTWCMASEDVHQFKDYFDGITPYNKQDLNG